MVNSIKKKSDTISHIDQTYIYSIILRNLKPNTTYYYQISSDLTYKREIISFTTLPIKLKELKFQVISDSHGKSNRRKLRNDLFDLIEKENFDLFIHCGDMVDNGSDQIQWNDFFQDFEDINSRKIGLYIEGNHDVKRDYDLIHDNLPFFFDKHYFSIRFRGFAHFLGLSTENYISSNIINNELNSSNNIDWKFSFLHKPIFNSMKYREDLDINWNELFGLYNLDLIFSGHNHAYERNFIDYLYYITDPAISGSFKDLENFEFLNRTICYKFVRDYIIVEIKEDVLTMNAFGYNEQSENIFKFENLTILKYS